MWVHLELLYEAELHESDISVLSWRFIEIVLG